MATRPPKLPQSVLVVIHTPDLQVLLIERADAPGFWQSVTGAKDTPDEPFDVTAVREVAEETGIAEAALPFVGELIQVRSEEQGWQGAIERVLGGFALSLLVDDNNVGGYGVGTVAMSGATIEPGAFSDTGSMTLPASDPYALTLVVDITHGISGGTTSFDFAGTTAVPEPSGVALISMALLMVAGATSRRRKAHVRPGSGLAVAA